jgi:hypothetical protein
MRLDAVTAEIRPRSDWEAVDLGLAMVRRDFWRCFTTWWLVMVVPVAAVGWWLWESPMLWLMVFWWWKPAGSRMVLFELSRRLFGERPAWRATLREIPRAWTRRFFYRFVWARFSPWLPVTLAVEDLEGLRGKAYKQRCIQVTRRGEGVVIWIYLVADMAACWFGFAIVVLVKMFIPEGQDCAWRLAMESWDSENLMSLPLLIVRAMVCCVMLAMSLTDLFITGAGFGVYLNNRSWIEGWDVELAFKRLARRLAKAAMMAALLCAVCLPADCRAAAERDPAGVIHEVMADEAFKVHTVIEKVPVPSRYEFSWKWPQWLTPGNAPQWLALLLVWAVFAILLGAILWLLWQNRRAIMRRRAGLEKPGGSSTARVVMGMDVSPATLPGDVPAAAWALWRQGRQQEALGLLYRGAISRVMEVARVEIQESDTEGDCVRRVDLAGPAAHPDYFRGITGAWSRLAYAGLCPAEREVEVLCQKWPFVERRDE